MFQNHHRYIDFLVEHQLTNEQFMFLYILYADSLETDGDGDRVFPREGPDSLDLEVCTGNEELAARQPAGPG